MHIKRFEAATMEEALALVKAELGPEALILSSRTIRRGRRSLGLMARSVVEVQAARERGEGKALSGPGSSLGPQGQALAIPEDHDPEERALLSELRRELAILRGRERFEEEVRSELRGLRDAMNGVLGARMRDDADPIVQSLAKKGLDWIHAESIVSEWRETTGGGDRSLIKDILEKRIESRLAPPREGPNIRILVGAPGVGKTTTLAKLAARNEEGEREVALVSLDHYRIGATDQLRRYAELLGSPFGEAARFSELPSVVDRFRGHAVLVDTAGRGPRSEEGFESLSSLREAMGSDVSVELVLDATARRAVLQAQLSRFAPMAPDRLIFAKTDECDSLADATNLLLDNDSPTSCWMGTGQRVPEDLRPLEARQLARSVLGEAA